MSKNNPKIGSELRVAIEQGLWPKCEIVSYPDMIQSTTSKDPESCKSLWQYARKSIDASNWDWLLLEIPLERFDSVCNWLNELDIQPQEIFQMRILETVAVHMPSFQCLLDMLLGNIEIIRITLSNDDFSIQ
jgi:hypothetical protein